MFTPEQLRHLENLRLAYDAWVPAARAGRACGPRLQWKTSAGRNYLYEITSRRNDGRSLGPRSETTEALHAERSRCRADADARLAAIKPRLAELAALHRALRLPRVDAQLGEVLREFELSGLLGDCLLVVGTNAMTAYEVEAQTRFASGYDSTLDADFTWRAPATALLLKQPAHPPITAALKRIDATYTVNTEKPFQARDARGYEVEILVAPSAAAAYPTQERLRPVALPEQEWLLLGQPVEAVLFDQANKPVRLVVPDPRWMALHKAWLADKPKRSRLKFAKDAKPAELLAGAIRAHMPHYVVDEGFLSVLPEVLRPYGARLFG